MEAEEIARWAHEVNRAVQGLTGEEVSPPWEDAPEYQRSSTLNGVQLHLDSPGTTPEQSHENWLKLKYEDGWVWGPVKDESNKEHPCMLPYDELPPEQKIKDAVFRAVVGSLR